MKEDRSFAMKRIVEAARGTVKAAKCKFIVRSSFTWTPHSRCSQESTYSLNICIRSTKLPAAQLHEVQTTREGSRRARARPNATTPLAPRVPPPAERSRVCFRPRADQVEGCGWCQPECKRNCDSDMRSRRQSAGELNAGCRPGPGTCRARGK